MEAHVVKDWSSVYQCKGGGTFNKWNSRSLGTLYLGRLKRVLMDPWVNFHKSLLFLKAHAWHLKLSGYHYGNIISSSCTSSCCVVPSAARSLTDSIDRTSNYQNWELSNALVFIKFPSPKYFIMIRKWANPKQKSFWNGQWSHTLKSRGKMFILHISLYTMVGSAGLVERVMMTFSFMLSLQFQSLAYASHGDLTSPRGSAPQMEFFRGTRTFQKWDLIGVLG